MSSIGPNYRSYDSKLSSDLASLAKALAHPKGKDLAKLIRNIDTRVEGFASEIAAYRAHTEETRGGTEEAILTSIKGIAEELISKKGPRKVDDLAGQLRLSMDKLSKAVTPSTFIKALRAVLAPLANLLVLLGKKLGLNSIDAYPPKSFGALRENLLFRLVEFKETHALQEGVNAELARLMQELEKCKSPEDEVKTAEGSRPAYDVCQRLDVFMDRYLAVDALDLIEEKLTAIKTNESLRKQRSVEEDNPERGKDNTMQRALESHVNKLLAALEKYPKDPSEGVKEPGELKRAIAAFTDFERTIPRFPNKT